jgi:hypothetical protein
MTSDQTRSLKAAALAIAAILFIIGGFLDPTSYDTTVTMWGVGFGLVTLVLLLDQMPHLMGGPREPS